jgi:ABC-type Fe3+-siderophore transport system permease subunit
MNNRVRKKITLAIIFGGLLLLVLKLFGFNLFSTELILLFFCFAFLCMIFFRFQQRRQRRQLDLMRDSALW